MDNLLNDLNAQSGLNDHHDQNDIFNGVDVEMALLSLCMRKNTAVLQTVENRIVADDFTDKRNRIIFTVIIDMFFDNAQIDRFTVYSELERRGLAERCGGQRYLYRIGDLTAVQSAIDGYIDAVKERSGRFKILKAVDDIKNETTGGKRRSAEVVDYAISEMTKLKSDGETRGVEKLSSSLKTTMNNIAAEIRDGNAGRKVKVGYPKLDAMLGGLRPGTLNILAARPAMGKSALAINMAVNAAANGKTVVIFSLEMSKDEINMRLLSQAMSKPVSEILNSKTLTDSDRQLIDHALVKLSDYPIYQDDNSNTNPASMKATLQQLISSGIQPGLVIVDYLQLMSIKSMAGRSRNEEVTAISRQLKLLAKELNVPVIALSQLSRDNAKRTDHTPQLSDLRDSGAIEQDADTVMFVDRPDYYGGKDKGNTPSAPPQAQSSTDDSVAKPAYIYLSKNRHGATGRDSVWWIPSKTLFYEPDEKDPVEPDSPYAKTASADAASQNYGFEDNDEPEAPLSEEDEMQQAHEAFMADSHDEFPQGFM